MGKALFCWSGGKDSAAALYDVQQSKQYEIAALLVTVNEDYDRVSMHGVRRTLIEQQALSIGLPIEEVSVPTSSSNEEYESRMRQTLTRLQQGGVVAAIFGDIFLEEVRKYREENLARIGMKAVFPLWGKDAKGLFRSFLALGFKAIITCVDAKVLDKKFIGRTLDDDFLAELPPGVDPCGENGEFHSFVYDGPIFNKPVEFTLGDVVLRDSFYYGDLVPKVNKTGGK